MKRLPLFATLIVTLAVLTMIGLGIWQLQRKGQKEAVLALYETAADLPPIAYPSTPVTEDLPLFRQSSVQCIKVTGWRSISGKSASGEAGWAHLASCQTGGAEGPGAVVAVGWSKRPDNPEWDGGLIKGMIAPDGPHLIKLVASEPVKGLEILAPPSPDSIANNHLLYAIQWFLFAAAAAVIYPLAVRKKMAGSKDPAEFSE